MLAGGMISFSDSSVLFVLWGVCGGGGGGVLFLSFKALCHSKMTQGIDTMQAPFINWKCKDRKKCDLKIQEGYYEGVKSTLWSMWAMSELKHVSTGSVAAHIGDPFAISCPTQGKKPGRNPKCGRF